ncbi:hypothetical protein PHYBLDRAFT_185834 [Phycomyces blakesleeanus NRRL 1555(-)]|uniref:RRM domain-containing protein n=2 Tax=Phycomyces blakesleeanus TaxID=4837 RepID=A0A162PWU5_PHYB8|nr:hypothetical protein PHYBLDRAFT_185834 [Phycomyces blakesleeanus NRRL 1555(-)]OAD76727.1 hypothetical protein PHYBLDRAFT_185834 [Phycomyces blakesleeanus NRRL 1555(-)]|eukprot:XP_018294767.1 hypothetical protein PHYBLDRAFT_185834 [Phycomyces blakesleeanus NRRL 1555(-)]
MKTIAVDLDTSLDEIIKTRKNRHSRDNNFYSKSSYKPAGSDNRRVEKHETYRKSQHPYSKPSRYNTSESSDNRRPTYSARPAKASPLQSSSSSSSNSHNSSSHNTSKPDPSRIVITKSVTRRLPMDLMINQDAKLDDGSEMGRIRKQPPLSHEIRLGAPQQPLYQHQPTNYAIRGLSQQSPVRGLSIRGESGPAVVLISNLDPGANAEDVKTVCAYFGHILQCKILLDRSGRSYGEAEIEFAHKSSALDCVAKMDNGIADGRVLRVMLRNRMTPTAPLMPPPIPNQNNTRSVITPTRSGYTSGAKPYSDHNIPVGPASNELPDYSRYQSFTGGNRRY